MIKLLICGLANSGKTSLCKTLKDAFIVSYDGKPCSLVMPHTDIKDFESIDDLKMLVNDKILKYRDKFGKLPATVVFDSVSRIEDHIEDYCKVKYRGFDIWSGVSAEIKNLCDYINNLLDKMNVVIICHTTFNEKATKYIETCKGSFAKIGGFLSTVDYAITTERSGKKYKVVHKGQTARTLLDDMPAEEEADDFNLQEYINKIAEQANKSNEWAI